MKIYVDADACPAEAEKEIISISEKKQLPVILVKSFSHFSLAEKPAHVETVYVDKGADAADLRIIQLAKKDDIIITQDYGLAALGLGKGCIVLHHKGFIYKEKNIDRLLATRHASAMIRRGGGRTKGPKAYSEEDKNKFVQLLMKTIERLT